MSLSQPTKDLRSFPRNERHRCTSLSTQIKVIVALIVLVFTGTAFAQDAKSDALPAPPKISTSEWARIREGLRKAKPIPNPRNAIRPESLTPSGDLLRFDSLTGQSFNVAPSKADAESLGLHREEQHMGASPTSANGSDDATPLSKVLQGIGRTTSAAANISRQDITPTPPSPLYYPYSYPWNTEFRLLMRFTVAGFSDQYYLCSASSASDFHLLSAAHCIYNHDPLDDGSGRGAGFAAEVWAWPAETDVVDPIDPDNWPDFPYGVAKMTYETTYNAWISSSDLNWDFSFITLDRRIGDHVGWMGREWGVNASALNFDGYPAQYPYVPSDNPYQYPGFDAGNVIGYTCCRIEMSAYTYGGHSGGGVWRYDGTNDYIEGVNSTSNRVGYAEATLFTSQTSTDLSNTITNDKSVRPPVDRAQLIEYVFNGTSKGLLTSQVAIGSSLGVTLNAFNAGYAPAGDTTAYIYLTKSESDVTSGTYIGAIDLGSLDTYQYTVQNRYISVPSFVAPGSYYVGWLLGGANSQYGTDKNVAIITSSILNVVALSSVSTSPGSLLGGSSSTGTVFLTSVAPSGGIDISLSSNTSVAHVPTSVHVNSGASSATFPITTDGVGVTTVATITANGSGVVRTATVTINAASLLSMSISPSSVVGSNTAIGTVKISGPAQAGGTNFPLVSSSTSAQLPAKVHIATGATTGTFTITTSVVTSTTPVTISATHSGVTKSAVLTIQPPALTGMSLSPTTLVGGKTSIGTVTISGPAQAGGTNFSLTSSSTLAQVPAKVHIATGATSGTFTITTSGVGTTTAATISVTHSGVTKTAVLTIQPAVLTGLSLSPSSVKGGNTSVGTVTLSGPAQAGGTNFPLTSSSSKAQVPASVHISTGSSTGTFTVTTSSVTSTSTATISATHSGVTKAATLTIQP
jgi:hypothetical protein